MLILKHQRRPPCTKEGGDLQPVVPSPASPINCASWAILASVFSSCGSELPKIPSKIVLLISSGLGELLILRTLFIHHYIPSSTLNFRNLQESQKPAPLLVYPPHPPKGAEEVTLVLLRQGHYSLAESSSGFFGINTPHKNERIVRKAHSKEERDFLPFAFPTFRSGSE